MTTLTYDLLAIDAGNTTVVFGYFKNHQLIKKFRVETTNFALPQIEPVNKILISSVVPPIDHILAKLSPQPIFITSQNIPDIKVNILNPSEAGADRIVNAYGAYKLYNSDCIIIDFGTATTVCLVRKEGIYEGGAIIAGIKTSLKALNQFTAKIPLFEHFSRPSNYLGKSTEESVLMGQYWGHVGALKNFIALYKQNAPQAKVIATGGYAKMFAQDIKEIDIVDEDLTLKSLELLGRALAN